MFLSMLQYMFIHAEASNTMDQKPSHPKPWTENHRVQNHGLKPSHPKPCAKIMHKTIGRSAQPNIGSKKNSQGTAPDPVQGGYPPPATQSVEQSGGSAPPLTPRFTMWASRGKNNTTQHSPTCCFLSTGGYKRA